MKTERLIGKTVIVGFAYYDENDHWIQNIQFHGKIMNADDKNGIVVFDKDKGETHTLPPQEDAVFPAPPGEYKEHISGQSIENPDFISFWKVKKCPSPDDKWAWHAIWLDVQNWRSDKEPQQTSAGDNVANRAAPAK